MATPIYTFNFPFHRIGEEYPNNSAVIQMGRGYSFAAVPDGPPQITFNLKFPTMWRWFDARGDVDKMFNPETNLEKLIFFYEYHQLAYQFYYPHKTRGNLLCRFKAPLQVPTNLGGDQVTPLAGGYRGHAVEAFDVSLIMQP